MYREKKGTAILTHAAVLSALGPLGALATAIASPLLKGQVHAGEVEAGPARDDGVAGDALQLQDVGLGDCFPENGYC